MSHVSRAPLGAVDLPGSQSIDLTGMSILVTGASSGIGKSAAMALAAHGAHVFLLARNSQALVEVQRQIQEQYPLGGSEVLVADISDIASLCNQIAKLPNLTGLVNSAGCNTPQLIEEVDQTTFDTIFGLNVKATFFVTQACVQKFRDFGHGGAIVNVSSQMGHVGARRRVVYCASKHAVEGLTKAMAVELAPEGIRVNSVCPTFISTAMTAPMFEDRTFRSEVESKIPMGRIGSAQEVAGAIAFLLSPASSLITGASLLIDGGWTAQ